MITPLFRYCSCRFLVILVYSKCSIICGLWSKCTIFLDFSLFLAAYITSCEEDIDPFIGTLDYIFVPDAQRR